MAARRPGSGNEPVPAGSGEWVARGTPLAPNRLKLHPSAWIAPGAVLVGDVTVGDEASIWYGCVLRGDLEPIRVGRATNIQDLTLIHVDHGLPAIVGDRVTIGHRCVIHGCTVEDEALVGMGAVVLNGARIGKGALVAAGAVVLEGFEVPAGTVAAGVPAKVRGKVEPGLRERMLGGVDDYRVSARGYLAGDLGGGPHGGGLPEGEPRPPGSDQGSDREP
jgi:carbonic anhydrase/acetyltransferase-like protein (isoleucine patch superfamily)